MTASALLPVGDILVPHPPLLPPLGDMSLDAFGRAWAIGEVILWFRNSVAVTVGAAIASLVLSVLAGYSLSRFRSRSGSLFGYSLFISRVLPGTLLIIPLFIMFSALHLLNNLLAVIAADVTSILPFTVWFMKGFFDGVPPSLEEAAMVDGCGRLEALWRVTLPLVRPGLAATAVYAGVVAWSDFLYARTLLVKPDTWTVPIGIVSFINQYTIDWSGMMAMAVMAVVPAFIALTVLEPYLSGGLTAGAVVE
jgi:multiple sugar transport system permease protein